jgi:hypothetical protein
MSDSRRVNEVRANCELLNGDGVLHRFAKQNNYKELEKVSPGPGVSCWNNRMEYSIDCGGASWRNPRHLILNNPGSGCRRPGRTR